MECTENRKFDLNSIPDKPPDEAWAALKKASDERDLEHFREVGNNEDGKTATDSDRASRCTPRLFRRPLLWTSKKRCVRTTSTCTSLPWLAFPSPMLPESVT